MWVERRDVPTVATPARLAACGAALLVLVALAIPRSVSVKIGVVYFLGVIAAAFCAWILGTVVVADGKRLRLLLNVLTILGVFIALHSILSARFGIFLFDTPAHASYLRSQHYFYFLVNHYYRPPARASSFLENPDSLGALLAVLFFLPAGLFFAARSPIERALYLAAVVVVAIALLLTVTAAAWVAVLVALVPLVALAVRPRLAARTLAGAAVIGLAGGLLFHTEVRRLLAHATSPNELSLRIRIWQTALKIIAANPLTGIGLGVGQPFIQRSAPYAVGMNIGIRDHPHNSFLELAALAGIPVMLVFWQSWSERHARRASNYRLATWEYRPLLAGVFAALIALTVHGLADATWTLPPIVPIAWMLVGAVSSRQFGAALPSTPSEIAATGAQPVRYPAVNADLEPVRLMIRMKERNEAGE